MSQFPKFTKADFLAAQVQNCSEEFCDVSFIVSGPPASSGGGCCDCPPGPPGPPGPAGPPGEAGDASCFKVYAGPLFPDSGQGVDPLAFEELKQKKGYIVRLNLGTQGYSQSYDASVVVNGPSGNGYISLSGANAGTINGSSQISENGIIYPLAIQKSFGEYYNYSSINTFEDFLKAKAGQEGKVDLDYYTKQENVNKIPDLLNNASTGGLYTFISNDNSVKESPNGPYNLTAFKDLVTGITDGSIKADGIKSDNPPSLTNLGRLIKKADGSIGADYDCEDCIKPKEGEYVLASDTELGPCDVFVDTENGVLYERDPTNWGEDGDGGPRFKEHGIPLRRQPVIPEIPPPPEETTFLAIITGNTPFNQTLTPALPAPYYRWLYSFKPATFDTVSTSPTFNKFIASSSTKYDNVKAWNGAENNNILEAIGEGMFANFNSSQFEMLPIRTGTVVTIKFAAGKYIFTIPNAYKAGCPQ